MHSHISSIMAIADITNPVAAIAVVGVIIANAIATIAIVDVINNAGADVGNVFSNDDGFSDGVGVPVKLALSGSVDDAVGVSFGKVVNDDGRNDIRDDAGEAVNLVLKLSVGSAVNMGSDTVDDAVGLSFGKVVSDDSRGGISDDIVEEPFRPEI